MKLLLIIMVLFGCQSVKQPTPSTDTTNIQRYVTVIAVKDTSVPKVDTLFEHCNADSLKAALKQSKQQSFVYRYKVERVRYYLKITQKNPSQTKFLKSWISRAVQ